MIYRTVKGVKLPALGFGTYHLTGPEGVKSIRHAIDVGYRHLDTAIRYGNEAEVGQAIKESGIDRSELFVTTKLRYTELSAPLVEQCTQESLERLQTDYVDLLLMHWPSQTVDLGETLGAMERIRQRGQTRFIGVSNFTTKLMKEAVETHGTDIFTNQVEYHPYLNQQPLFEYMRPRGILLTAAVPLARGKVNTEHVLVSLGEKYGKTPAQITLRWLVQQDGVAAIPKASNEKRIRENFEIFDFDLSDDDMAAINSLLGHGRLIDPEWAPEWDPA